MNGQRGSGLIEVIIAIGVLMIGLVGLFDLLLYQKVSNSRVDKVEILKSVLVGNSLEIEGRAYLDIPAGGYCMVRYYGAQGEYLREESVAVNHQSCTYVVPQDATMKAMWKVSIVTNAQVTFSNAALSMPLFSSPLKKVELIGSIRRDNGTYQSLSLVQYKADGG